VEERNRRFFNRARSRRRVRYRALAVAGVKDPR
jgi:hypothetical protein